MMKIRLLALAVILSIFSAQDLRAQSEISLFLNEFSASNINGPTDNYGQHSDWVEIKSTFSQSVSLQSYYLSNDPLDPFKWQFPASFVLQPGEMKTVWLSGRNVSDGTNFHANFTLEQCKDQWLVLRTGQGVIRDSVFVYHTMRNHSWGRVDNKVMGKDGWRLYSTPSYLQDNDPINNYTGYAPKPEIVVKPTTSDSSNVDKGGLYPGPQIVYFKLNGEPYDTLTQGCFHIFYTVSVPGVNSDYPRPSYPPATPDVNTKQFYRSLDGFLTLDQSSIVRAIAIQNPTSTACPGKYLPSFCESNTYFIDPDQQEYDKNFGLLSVAFDRFDNGWFNQGGNPASTTVHVEYFDNKKQFCEGYGMLNRPINDTWQTKQKGFYITMDDRLGFGCGFNGTVFNVELLGTSTRTNFPTLHVKGDDYESSSALSFPGAENVSFGTGMRDVLMQSLCAKYKVDVNPFHIKPLVVTMDGRYVGAYNFYEVYDRYYEEYYHGQGADSLTLNFVHNNTEAQVTYFDGTNSAYDPTGWRRDVYDFVITNNNPVNAKKNYDKIMSFIDKSSFIDYFVTSSYAVNNDIFNYNFAFAKGGNPSKPGYKYHYYLWTMPSAFSFSTISVADKGFENPPDRSPCYYYQKAYQPQNALSWAYTGNGEVFKKLMTTIDNGKQANYAFQLEFRNRYMDLLNGPFKCENILKQFDALYEMYAVEMRRHENPEFNGKFFINELGNWDSNMVHLREKINGRCYLNSTYFNTKNCFSTAGPIGITVDVLPAGAGKVKLNSTILEEYKWSGNYFVTTLSFKAIPTSTNYVFDHWEFTRHTPTRPATMDSVAIEFNQPGEEVVAVFTDLTKDATMGENIPNAFTPNGDGVNDIFRPLGAALHSNNYEMIVFNRWGQEVFRSVDPEIGWDGYFKGQPAITGVYAYLITYKNIHGEDKVAKGNVTLTR